MISIFFPTLILDSVFDINEEFIVKHEIKGIILDIDNTLTSHGNPKPAKGVEEWLSTMKALGVQLMIVSNNYEKRVKPFADELGLDFVSMGCKPLTFGLTRACKRFKLPKKNVCIVGDQIFTDIVAGNLKGIKSYLVSPHELETTIFFKFKRFLEKLIIKLYLKKQKKGKD